MSVRGNDAATPDQEAKDVNQRAMFGNDDTPRGKACACNCCGFGFSIGRPCGIIFCCIPCMC